MDYTKLSLTNCINLACSEFGLEDTHTIAIARLVDLVATGYLTEEEATPMAQIIYHHGTTELRFVGDPDDPWDEDEEYIEGNVEMGFNPYMGCNDWDC